MCCEERGLIVSDRQDRLEGYSTKTFNQKSVALIGAGGMGSAFGLGLTRKGIGRLVIIDDDTVELTNLHRTIYREEDLFLPKAVRLAKALSREGFLGTQLVGHHVAFDETVADALIDDSVDLAIVAVDNDMTRVVASRYFRRRQIPCIHAAVNEEATFGWCFLELPGEACVACVFPDIVEASSEPRPCTPVPAVYNILLSIAGPVLQAVDSVLMERPRGWKFHSIHLVGTVPGIIGPVSQRPGCKLCAK